MPWIAIIVWIISFIMAGGTKSGQAGKAALIATGVAAATYATVEPTNKDALFGDASRSFFGYPASGDPSVANADAANAAKNADGSTSGSIAKLGGQLVTTTGDVLKSWGPTGTLGVVAGTAAVTGSGIFGELKKVPMWVWVGGGALFLLTRN